jgi:hypothetical protein
MQKLPDFVPASSHRLKPVKRDGSQFTGMLFHPRIDGRIPLDSAIESQQLRFHYSSRADIGSIRAVARPGRKHAGNPAPTTSTATATKE